LKYQQNPWLLFHKNTRQAAACITFSEIYFTSFRNFWKKKNLFLKKNQSEIYIEELLLSN